MKGKTFDDEPVKVDNVEDFSIIDCTFSYDKNEKDMLELYNCRNVKVIDCTFKDKKTKGNFIHLKGEKTSENTIEDCTFRNHKFGGRNGGEAIIIGLGEYSGCKFKTHIKNCEFIKCNGDPEMVSIKSCNNILEGNTVKDGTRGNFTIRNGGFNEIINNTFIGTGGIRVLGKRNKIIGNIHKKNKSKDFPPLTIENADEPEDKNFENGKPTCKKIKKNTAYAQAKDNTIENNRYEDCDLCVIWGKKSKDEVPEGNEFRNNILIANSVRSKFLEFASKRETHLRNNTFSNNKMNGSRADLGAMPKAAIA
jgi:Chondroitinase B